jgi:hypothetical protein
VSTGTKEDELSTGHVWAAGCHHDTARYRLVHVLKGMNCLFLSLSNFLFSGRDKQRLTETADAGSVDMGA